MMKSSKIGLGIIILLIVWIGFYVMGVYNTLVVKDEGVQTAWSQVENQYQRRTDLIPNLVNTGRGSR
jgi:LemA protein